MNVTTEPIKWKSALKAMKKLREEFAKDKVDARSVMLFHVALYTAFRYSDYVEVKWKDLYNKKVWKVKQKKNKKWRTVDLHPQLIEAVKLCFPGDEHLEDHILVSKRGPNIGKPLTLTGLNSLIRKTLDKYKIEHNNASSHSLRKTWATRFYEANGKTDEALILLSELLVHADTKVTRAYIGITREVRRKAYTEMV